ncbi:MAG: hypothetical protein AAF688_12805, partial [Bacteroidota bacterium]
MKKIPNKNLNYNNYGKVIDHHVQPLRQERLKNKKKIIEICHTGKFLIVLGGDHEIHEVREKPDFIIKSPNLTFGLEHQIIVDDKAKEREGFFQGIFDRAESILQKDSDLPNFLANCYLKPYVNFKINHKPELIDIICQVVKEYVQNEIIIENPIIERIGKMRHSQINVNVNLGAWWQQYLTHDLLTQAIKRKEEKITLYKNNTISCQWLLLVIGSTGESSYVIEDMEDYKIESLFDKIYVMEDLSANVYEVK